MKDWRDKEGLSPQYKKWEGTERDLLENKERGNTGLIW